MTAKTDLDAATDSVVDGVRAVLVRTLGIEDRLEAIDARTGLLGELPELDSLAIVELVVALEVHFGMSLADEDITGDAFATVGTLAELVARQRPAA
jgi:acyl carrier protein